MSHTVSAIVITFNEQENIDACLGSLTWCDEIVVVDSNSTDRTREIASRFTPHVFVNPWPGFSEQKNYAASRATGDWILHVDADERITPALRDEIISLVRDPGDGPRCDGYFMPRINHWLGRPIFHGGWYPDYSVRLFRRGKATCVGMSHETFVVDGPTGRLKNPLMHYSYRSVRQHAERAVLRSAPLDALELFTGGELRWFLPPAVSAAIWRQVIRGPRSALAFRQLYKTLIKNRIEFVWLLPFWPLVRFVHRYIIRQGFRDGAHGFWIAVLSAVYEAVRCAIIWEHYTVRRGGTSPSPAPAPRIEPAYVVDDRKLVDEVERRGQRCRSA